MKEEKKQETKKPTAEQRQQLFQEELTAISSKYKLELYAANILIKNGEVVPMVKLFDRETVEPQTQAEEVLKV